MYNVQYIYIYIFSIKQLTSGLLQILPSDWLSYSLSIGDRPLVAKELIFTSKTICKILAFCRGLN